MKYSLHPEAAAEHIDHLAFYELRQSGLGKRYHLAFQSTVREVCEAPQRYRRVGTALVIRCARLPGFPYSLLFRETDNTIQILAIAHHRRRPNY